MNLQIDLFQEIIFSEGYAESRNLQEIVKRSTHFPNLDEIIAIIDYLTKVSPELNKGGLKREYIEKKKNQIEEFLNQLILANEFRFSGLNASQLSVLLLEEQNPQIIKRLIKYKPNLGWVSVLFDSSPYERQLQYFLQCTRQQYEDISKIEELDIFEIYFKDIKSKPKIKKLLKEKIILNGEVLNIDLIYCLFYIHELNFNYDKACDVINNDEWVNFPHFFVSEKHLTQFKNLLSENYSWGLIKSMKDPYDLYDSIQMLNNLGPEYRLPKAKDLMEFHQLLTRDCNRLNSNNLTFLQKELEKIDGYKMPNLEISLHLPQTSQELVNIGNKLNICVGTANYDIKIAYRGHFIVELRNLDLKTIGCVELTKSEGRWDILQAKGFKNKPLSSEFIKEFYELLNETNLFSK